MKNKKIVVLLKYFKGELNLFDGAALECALETGAKEIIALTMAPKSALSAFQSITRLGVKCVMITDPVYAGSDTQATSFILAKALKCLHPDLIFCGRQSVDGDTAQVPPMLAQRLGFQIKVKAMAFNGQEIILRSGESFTLQDKTVLTFEKIRTLRFPSIFSKLGDVEIWDNNVLQLPIERCGLNGSPTRVIKSYESSVGRRSCQFVGIEKLDTLIQEGLKKQRIEKAQTAEEKLNECYFVGNVKDIAEGIAESAIDQIEKIKELAKKHNAEVCCSRIVADNGKLSYEKQVGLTGRTVCPKVYVAFGISGAVQHTCAIAGAGMVIAVNTDKQARIFDYADYGIIQDVSIF